MTNNKPDASVSRQGHKITQAQALAALTSALGKHCPNCKIEVSKDKSQVTATQGAGYYRVVVREISFGEEYSFGMHRELRPGNGDWAEDWSYYGKNRNALVSVGQGVSVYKGTVEEQYEQAVKSALQVMTPIAF